ncbi:MAG: SDR family NAD(P)-dependent oxidoreductase [Candidatus Izemoplasmatales bacterium]|nr:SDR family NAD(P)-dependent oxidoreductase [Candidatus Izemoplasmatales bacterium]
MKVLITGAAGGLGRTYINECIKRSYEVCATDINNNGLITMREGIYNRYRKNILTYPCDLTNDNSVNKLMDYLKEQQFEVDMLLNVAGIDFEGGFLDRSFSEIQNVINLNILGTLRVTHKILSSKEFSKRFYIINISSLAAEQPIPLKATYAASKRFLLDFSRAIGEELKSKHVNVLAVCPGGLATTCEVMHAINGQGFFGAITTCNMERVVTHSIDYVLKGKTKYIPGIFNKLASCLNYLLPINFTTKYLYKRWAKAQSTWLTGLVEEIKV